MANEIATQLIRSIENQDWLEPVEESVQNAVSKAFEQAGRGVQDALNGVWLGHPLHPAVTDIPVGAWTTALVLDLACMAGAKRGFRDAADAAVGVGLAGAAVSAITGLADWKDIKGKDRRPGLVHATLNTVVATLYTGSLIARRNRARGLGQALGIAGWSLMLVSAWIGGELVYKYRDGVDQSSQIEPLEDWTELMPESDLAENQLRRAEAKGAKILLLRRGNRIFAIGETCSHRGGPLSEGKLDGDCVECPWHGSVFNLNDGTVEHGPATHSQPRYDIRVRDGRIEAKLAE
jgi:nitrite reductase/ring-hydroxylating ferredoxin subunit/uncharacterized membrane protein